MSTEKRFIDHPVANLALEPGIDYFVAILKDPTDKAYLSLGKQGLQIANLTGLTQGPFLRPIGKPETYSSRETPEAEDEWQENGFYLARLSIGSSVAYLRELGDMSAISIGRDPSSAISISDTTVSRRHLSIGSRPSGQQPPSNHDYFVIQDLGSTNGTRLTTNI